MLYEVNRGIVWFLNMSLARFKCGQKGAIEREAKREEKDI
jgi:hypothetical protein